MPPLRVRIPLSLEKLCFQEIMNLIRKELIICDFIRRFEKTSLILRCRDIHADCLQSEVANYLKRLPPLLSENIRQEITDKLMSLGSNDVLEPYLQEMPDTEEGQKNIVMMMLEVVLNHEISSIEFKNGGRVNGMGLSSQIWPLILGCSGLKRLVLVPHMFAQELRAPSITSPFLTRLTIGCPLLTELVLPEIVTDSKPLRAIGQNCHFLQKLDISSSHNVTNQIILHLCLKSTSEGCLTRTNAQADDELVHVADNLTPLCRTLTALILTNTCVRAKGAGFLLRVMPNLTTLGDLEYTVAGLKSIYTQLKAKKCHTLRLKHVYYKGPLNVRLKILANCCPNLDSLFLGSVTELRIHRSLHLCPPSFTKLTSLTLENINTADLAKTLQKTPNLLKLKVQCERLDVSVVSKYCPKLEELCLPKEPSKHMKHLEHRCFQALYKVECQAAMSHEVAAVFFTQALKLQVVEFVRVRDVTDDMFISWAMENRFKHLETFVIRFVELTRLSVDWLLANCSNLNKLGELGGWDIRSWECRRIKDFCVAKNYDLEVMVYMPMPTSLGYDIFSDQSISGDDSD